MVKTQEGSIPTIGTPLSRYGDKFSTSLAASFLASSINPEERKVRPQHSLPLELLPAGTITRRPEDSRSASPSRSICGSKYVLKVSESKTTYGPAVFFEASSELNGLESQRGSSRLLESPSSLSVIHGIPGIRSRKFASPTNFETRGAYLGR